MDEAKQLMGLLVKLRQRNGMTQAMIGGNQELLAAIGANSAEDAIARITAAIAQVDVEYQRLALEAAFTTGNNRNTPLRSRYEKLYDLTQRPYETTRKDSNAGIHHLARILHAQKTAEGSHLARPTPAITMDHSYTSFRSSHGQTVKAKVGTPGNYSRMTRVQVEVEALGDAMWLVRPDRINDDGVALHFFQRRHNSSHPHARYLLQLSMLLDSRGVELELSMSDSADYFFQISDDRGGWKSTMQHNKGTSIVSLAPSSLRTVRYFMDQTHAADFDRLSIPPKIEVP